MTETASKIRFRAKLVRPAAIAKAGSWTFLTLPKNSSAKLPSRGKTTVEGEITVNNHRKETIELVVRRRFSGELITADGNPKASLREEGAYSVNKRNELFWTIPLKAGEERKLKYRYSVLVMS